MYSITLIFHYNFCFFLCFLYINYLQIVRNSHLHNNLLSSSVTLNIVSCLLVGTWKAIANGKNWSFSRVILQFCILWITVGKILVSDWLLWLLKHRYRHFIRDGVLIINRVMAVLISERKRERPSWIFGQNSHSAKNRARHFSLNQFVYIQHDLCQFWCFYHQTDNFFTNLLH